jgi:hypothetical protein
VHDVLTVIHFVQTDQHETEKIHLVGLGPVAGPIAAAARAQAGSAINKAAIDTAGFRFASLDRLADPMFVPGAAKYHDVPGLLALNAPLSLWIAGESGTPERAADAYAAAGRGGALVPGKRSSDASAAVEWLVR